MRKTKEEERSAAYMKDQRGRREEERKQGS